MATKLYINLAAKSPRSALVLSDTITTPVPAPDLALGDKIPLEVYLLDGNGGIVDPTTYNMRLAVGVPGDVPTSGTYRITVGVSTTGVIPFNATAAQLQGYLEALGTIGTGNVTVSGEFPVYTITFIGTLANTNIASPSISATNLFPESSPQIIYTLNGGGGYNETWVLRLYRTPLALQTSWGISGSAYTGTLVCNTTALAQELGGDVEVASFLEVELTNVATSDIITALQVPCVLRADVTNASTTVPVPIDTTYTQPQAIAAFVGNYSSVTGLTGGGSNLDGVPTVGVTPGILAVINTASGEYVYRLTSGTTAEASPTVIRPDDYAASTNEKVWLLQTLAAGGLFALDSSVVNSFAGPVAMDQARFSSRSSLTTDGSLWNDSTSKALAGYTSGIAQRLSGCIFTQSAAGTAVTGTTAESTLIGSGVGTLTLPANFFVAGKTVRVRMSGQFNLATGTGDVLLKLKIGSASSGIGFPTATIGLRCWTIDAIITCRTTGSSGSYGVDFRFTYGGAEDTIHGVNAAATYSTATLNTTVSNALDVTVTHSSASGSNSWTSHTCTVEVLN